ncbi:MAG: ATP-dependent DNA helicase RecG [Eubacteriales bacterium]|nr:ATP-dependent DNA helicase RecG [Eubacteriales bacterium]
MQADNSITTVKGVGAKTTALFSKLHIETVGQLAAYFPRGYDRFEPPVFASELTPGELAAVRLCIVGTPSLTRARGMAVLHAQAGDATGRLRLTWFRMPYLKKTLLPGSWHVFRGVVRQGAQNSLVMEQPRVFSAEEYGKLSGTFQPRYGLTPGITSHMISKCVRQALDQLEFPDYLNQKLLEQYRLIPLAQAMEKIHFPKDEEEVRQARRRLVFDEFLAFLVQIKRQKAINGQLLVDRPLQPSAETKRLIEALPYRLTEAQKRVWGQIEKDLESHTAMNRLVQGDVGSGKTVLAFLALVLCSENGRQGCLMAPTEVLAAQHFEALTELKERCGLRISPILLTGSMTAKQKREAYEKIRQGQADAVIGTHALIQEKVEYRDLALVVTDEQHRFGVRQRELLSRKGESTHVLVMSATPIPRTLAIVLYGDLEVSVLDELPQNRLPIKNCVVNPSFRRKAYAFIEAQAQAGHQTYVICPMVEEGEESSEGLENVTDYAEKLREALPDTLRIGTLHGRMKAADKQRVMEAFAAGEIDVLVSTTVIEVGINVPNATVMLVENAERFGLAQLHQLRGRVGRGDAQSFCIFMTGDESGGKNKRLDVLNKSNDGFFIAGEDLKLRGPGDLFGIRQSGDLEFALGDIYQDSDVLLLAGELADRVLCGEVELPEKELGLFGRRIDYRTI